MKVVRDIKPKGKWIDGNKFLYKHLIFPKQREAVMEDIQFLAPRCSHSQLARNWMAKNLAYLKSLEDKAESQALE